MRVRLRRSPAASAQPNPVTMSASFKPSRPAKPAARCTRATATWNIQ